jgi:hypothetical protein
LSSLHKNTVQNAQKELQLLKRSTIMLVTKRDYTLKFNELIISDYYELRKRFPSYWIESAALLLRAPPKTTHRFSSPQWNPDS